MSLMLPKATYNLSCVFRRNQVQYTVSLCHFMWLRSTRSRRPSVCRVIYFISTFLVFYQSTLVLFNRNEHTNIIHNIWRSPPSPIAKGINWPVELSSYTPEIEFQTSASSVAKIVKMKIIPLRNEVRLYYLSPKSRVE
jgi:hypothetical protein